jgi:NADPH-dependent ferric siderophore reductase
MITAWRVFDVRVRELRRLSPSFLRVTFTGDDLDVFADNGFDQRIKLVLPLPGHGTAGFPSGPDWHARWREQPDGERNPIRTYTVRAVRPSSREVDVDVVLHGDGGTDPCHAAGPAARWAASVRAGDGAALFGPDARHEGPHGGLEFRPPADAGSLLLAGDETAVPAITAILERLPPDRTGEALLEVPLAVDVLDVAAPGGMRVTWLPRDGAEYGSRLVPAVQASAGRLVSAPLAPPVPPVPATLGDVDVDEEILWEVPDAAVSPPRSPYAWLAGEAGVIKTLRRHLVGERGLDRRSVAFMGYWRLGRAEGND